MSVPPVEAPMSNTMALPIAGKITAKHKSSHISPVIDVVETPGNSISNNETYPESAKDANTLQRIALRSRNMKPSTTSAMLMIHMNAPTGSDGNSVDRITDTPDVPPKAK